MRLEVCIPAAPGDAWGRDLPASLVGRKVELAHDDDLGIYDDGDDVYLVAPDSAAIVDAEVRGAGSILALTLEV